ncbi:8061_t:CDS:1, partial [Cetraspora pellucida]
MLQSKKAQFNIKLVPSRWYSKEGLLLREEVQEKSITLIQVETEFQTGTFKTLNNIRGQEIFDESFINLDSKKEIYSRGIGLCKKALNLAILNNSSKAFEELLQQFIKKQNKMSTESSEDSNNINNITDLIQHKGKGRPTNKRY